MATRLRAFALILLFTATTSVLAGTQQVAAWNADGRLCSARVPGSITNLTTVSAGWAFVAGIRADGSVVAWGDNTYGETDVPADMTGVGSGVSDVSAGIYHGLALRANGLVAAWGDNSKGQASVPAGLDHVIAVSAGGRHSLALKSNGTVVAWGDNTFGQCSIPGWLTGVVAVAAGNAHSLALRSDGTVVAWGVTNYGESSVPPGLSNVVAIDASSHSLALRADGTVVAWGESFFGETNVPPGLANVVAVDAGDMVSIARRADGSLVVWGTTAFAPDALGPFAQVSAGGVVVAARTVNPFPRVARLTTPLDFDGDGASDFALFDPRRALWYVKLSSTGQMLDGSPLSWQGQPVPGDYDGDGRCDVASFDGAGNWRIRRSSDGQLLDGGAIAFGWGGVVPVPADYDGDGRADLAVYDPQARAWYVRQSSDGRLMEDQGILFGVSGIHGVPVPGDLDGEGRSDLTVWDRRTGAFYARSSLTGQAMTWPFLNPATVDVYAPFAADVHGGAMADLGVYAWRSHVVRDFPPTYVPAGLFILYPYETIGPLSRSLGRYPITGDYDGDGIADLATYKPGNRQWTVLPSSGGGAVSFVWPDDRRTRGLVPLDNQFRINRALGAGP